MRADLTDVHAQGMQVRKRSGTREGEEEWGGGREGGSSPRTPRAEGHRTPSLGIRATGKAIWPRSSHKCHPHGNALRSGQTEGDRTEPK